MYYSRVESARYSQEKKPKIVPSSIYYLTIGISMSGDTMSLLELVKAFKELSTGIKRVTFTRGCYYSETSSRVGDFVAAHPVTERTSSQ